MNLLAILNENLSDTVVARAAYYVDESPDKTRVAVEGLLPIIVAGLMKRTTTEIGVNQLYNAIQKGKFDGTLVSAFPDLLRDPEQINRLTDLGSDSISYLLPAMKSSIGTMISSYAAIKNSAAISLLGLMTPMVLGVLNQITHEKKMDADGLALFLADQRDTLIEMTPERLMDRMAEGLGIQHLLAVGVTPAKRTMSADRSQRMIQERSRFVSELEEESNGSLAKWGVGVLVMLALAGGAYYIWTNRHSYSEANQEEAFLVNATDSTAADLRQTGSLGIPIPSDTMIFSGRGISKEFTIYIQDSQSETSRPFPQPAFDFEMGTSHLKESAQVVVDELAILLKNNPRVRVQLIGYADDAQAPQSNRSLSFNRANVIKQQLIRTGINYIRIDAIGRGTGGSDSTAVQGAPLRRIDIKVVTK